MGSDRKNTPENRDSVAVTRFYAPIDEHYHLFLFLVCSCFGIANYVPTSPLSVAIWDSRKKRLSTPVLVFSFLFWFVPSIVYSLLSRLTTIISQSSVCPMVTVMEDFGPMSVLVCVCVLCEFGRKRDIQKERGKEKRAPEKNGEKEKREQMKTTVHRSSFVWAYVNWWEPMGTMFGLLLVLLGWITQKSNSIRNPFEVTTQAQIRGKFMAINLGSSRNTNNNVEWVNNGPKQSAT